MQMTRAQADFLARYAVKSISGFSKTTKTPEDDYVKAVSTFKEILKASGADISITGGAAHEVEADSWTRVGHVHAKIPYLTPGLNEKFIEVNVPIMMVTGEFLNRESGEVLLYRSD